MSITLSRFKFLSQVDQLGTVLNEGTYLATRYEEEDTINLYHLGSFFVEVYYDPEVNHLHQCLCFTDAGGLEDYAVYVGLQDLGLGWG
ncbi:hypothetical protein [Hymenobacter sp. GOD-10R]|uniref:hypothetical protein n=1 Tax=Hymenobacter sp. GOD-10R TaxID=3093922 RepID=UPI002D781429|nr:hypothetical protein [Hymenobacter sp. GOD-10R]WRQ29134.1 hypothetical protein SD425_02510 [Hymenobacter sp. GOD-10R]